MKRINCILIVDDNEYDNELHSIAIEKAGVCKHIRIATHGKQALDYLMNSGNPLQNENNPVPDLIFLDLNMPGMNGFEFLEEYSKLNKGIRAKVVIVMLSLALTHEDEVRVNAFREVSGFIYKPLTVNVINETVAAFFNAM